MRSTSGREHGGVAVVRFLHQKQAREKSEEWLTRKGYQVFLPMHKVLRQWSDRKKKVEVPLFNSYIFVHVPENQVSEVVKAPGIAWAIRHNNKPAILQQKEYELINRFLETGLTLEVSSAESFIPGDWVTVRDGTLKGAVGQVTRLQPGKFTVLLEAIGQLMRVDLDPVLLKRLNNCFE